MPPEPPSDTVEQSSQPPPVGSGRGYRLEALDKNVPDLCFKESQEVSAGRLSSNDLMIQDNQYVSSTHFRILNQGGESSLFVLDLSRNGTWIGPSGALKKVGYQNRKLIHEGDLLSMLDQAIPDNKGKLLFRFCVSLPGREESQQQWGEVSTAYHMGKALGKGNFATVYHAKHLKTGNEVAVKVIDKKKLMYGMDIMLSKMLEEVRLLRSVSHPNIVDIVEVFDDDKYLCIVLELIRGGELFDYIVNSTNKFSEDEARELFKQIIEAFLYLHSNNVAHRDLKPENILVATKRDFILPSPSNSSGYSKSEVPVDKVVLKISDFGLAKWTGDSETMKTFCGTPLYIAPEVKKKKGYTLAVDMWSIGVILYILLCHRPPHEPQKGVAFPEKYWGSISADAQNLTKQLLTIDPTKRIGLHGVVTHPWMKGIEIKGAELAVAPQELQVGSPVKAHLKEEGAGVGEKRPRTSEIELPSPNTKKAKVEAEGPSPGDDDTEVGEDGGDHAAAPVWGWKSSLLGYDDVESSWTVYSPEECTRIEAAHLRFLEGKQKTVRVNKSYKIDFANKFQWNIEEPTKQRSVKRMTED